MATENKLGFGQTPVEPEFWFLKAPLYHSENYEFEDSRDVGFSSLRKNLLAVIFPEITIDVYCPNCERETVFVPKHRDIDWINEKDELIIRNGVSYTAFECGRRECRNGLFFVFLLHKGVLTKIGQYPSVADLVKPRIQRYRKVLTAEQLADWGRAVGLRAHGVGAGSYVYLRRIVEQLVEEARFAAAAGQDFDPDLYERSRWPERIKMLAKRLPDYLVAHSIVYGVLSKGVHELSEQKCTEHFDVMNTTIEIICEEKLAAIEREQKALAGSSALHKVLRSLEDEDD